MASFGSSNLEPQQGAIHRDNAAQNRFALISLTSLFFMWGFITAMNDILIPHLKACLISYTNDASAILLLWRLFLVSVPAGKLVPNWV